MRCDAATDASPPKRRSRLRPQLNSKTLDRPRLLVRTPQLEANLLDAWEQLPSEVRSRRATRADIAELERELGVVPDDYAWFLLNLGGGPVGTEWIDDLQTVRTSHRKFESEKELWTLRDCFIVGWDGAGNPLVIDDNTGKLITEDHNFGGIHEVSPSFFRFLSDGILRS
jgi:SMI1 / KNR4 family (SUKH-1)